MTTQPSIHYMAPSLWRRFAAMVYDTLLVVAVSILYGAIMTGLNVLLFGRPELGERVAWGPFQWVMFIGWIATVIGFFCFFWTRSGQTLGMKTWRIKILTPDLHLPSYRQCFIRCACAPFSLLCLAIGYWWIYSNPERQTLHDKISGTRTFLIAKQKSV